MTAVEVVTFGCRLNALESGVIERLAGGAGLQDTIIVNTCAVTAEAERQARQAIRRARRERPDARIIVTGCAATLDPQRYAALAEVDLILDNAAKLRPASYAAVLARSERNRRRVMGFARRRTAADAASASVVAGRRRSDPEAHEAAAQPGSGDRRGAACPRVAPRCRARRRSDRRLPDRNR